MFMERVAPVVDKTILALSKVKFVTDPIAGVSYSRKTSIVSSAYKRHGSILETALRESLRESNRHKVWKDDAFRVSGEADALANTQDLEACRQTTLPYGSKVRTRKLIWSRSTTLIVPFGHMKSSAAMGNSMPAKSGPLCGT